MGLHCLVVSADNWKPLFFSKTNYASISYKKGNNDYIIQSIFSPKPVLCRQWLRKQMYVDNWKPLVWRNA
mgnify:CR=1 FL=1